MDQDEDRSGRSRDGWAQTRRVDAADLDDWFKTRRGVRIEIKAVKLTDDDLPAMTSLFPEWDSPEDEAAFRDL